MSYKLLSLNVGRPETYTTDKGELTSAYRKKPMTEPAYLNFLHFAGDEQADKKHHGGPDQAVCLYPAQHYRHFEKVYELNFPYPSFGENITVEGIDEWGVNIGDVYSLGEAEVQVTKPRKPCYIIARTHGIDDFPGRLTKTGFTGFYLRVLKEGSVAQGDVLRLKRANPARVTVAEVNEVKFADKYNKEKISRIVQVDALAEDLRQSLQKRL
ncbi:MOSC domain-containing protein [Halobacillus shinanisalinarum]|uniref:MOSC domain-containing protein n=1 Tax=Halobacillus shinanisalinarum TaxID=2932258 RepID=A0ABY4GXS4_9BACI|nr:MOSC domain-containing protein [Halobacillus shinanisalinarum]UOQ92510.1 MOSC domain-containing protein [Halobacillus shinanisalinarum]